MIRNALRAIRSEVWAWRVSRSGRSRLARLRARINVDLQRGVRNQSYVNYDLRRGLPLPAGSCSIMILGNYGRTVRPRYRFE